MRLVTLILLLLLPLHCLAESGPPWMRHLLGDREFYEPWGIGMDFYTMDQQYQIRRLQFDLPGISIADPSQLAVENDIQHLDIKGDVWLTPFLNVFVLLGRLDAKTIVDLSTVTVTGLPFSLGKLPVHYDGTVYGAGATLVWGGEHWFSSLTGTWTDASLSGDFSSSVKSFSAQPRVGLVWDKWQFWVGGLYLDTEETHRGVIDLPLIGMVPFDVELEGADKWNTALGASYIFSPKTSLSFEVGFGNRDHTLFNFTYRF